MSDLSKPGEFESPQLTELREAMQTQPMTPDDTRERLARVSWQSDAVKMPYPWHAITWEEAPADEKQPHFDSVDAILAEQAAIPRYGVYVNGDLWAECSDEGRAVLIMDACAATFSPSASFDVMPIEKERT